MYHTKGGSRGGTEVPMWSGGKAPVWGLPQKLVR